MSYTWVIIIALVVLVYFAVPEVKIIADPLLDKASSVAKDKLNETLSEEEETIEAVDEDEIDLSKYSLVGLPSKLTEFNCRYHRDCELYIASCENNDCICLSNGECAITVG